MLHRLVKRQLKKFDLDQDAPPSPEVWQQFLKRVSQTYTEAERERYLLERSLTISSREMQDLYENLRQSSETRLAQEHDKLQAVVSAVGDGLCALDQDGYLLFINPAGQQLLGWPERDLMDRPLLDMLEAMELDKHITPTARLYQIIGAGQPYRNEDGSFKRQDGTVFPTSYVLNPIMNEEVLAGSVLVFRDITKRKQTELELQKYKENLEEQVAERTAELTTANTHLQQEIAEREQAEQALRISEANFRRVIASISDHIYMTEFTASGKPINRYLSPHLGDLTGYPLERFLADWSFWPSTVIHPEDREAAAVQAARLANGQNSEMEYRLVRADGHTIWVRDSGRVEKGFISPSLIVYGVVSDITERKQAEAALVQAHEQALEANRLKTQLLANVSHDLRTPLGAILGYTEILQEGLLGPVTQQQHQAIIEIIDSTDQLMNFVNNLLNQAQIEVGKLTLNIFEFEPAKLIEEVQVMVGGSVKAKGLELKSYIALDVPPTLYGDPYWLRQILVNLASNAVKFTEAGSVVINIYRPDEDRWALQVSDTGCGIPAEAQAYIFEPFRQVDGTATRGHSGSGLGLSIVKQLTQLMGGQIILESQVGQGSTFTIILQLHPVQAKMI